MEIGSTLIPDGVNWGTDLLNQRYVQTVQAEGGILAVEQAPNRKITLPFIYKGTSVDDANQFLQRLQYVTQPGNTLDVRPEGASWITRFDIEGGRVLANRDIRYHRQAIMQGTLELSTRPWGYTATWMIAASIAAAKPFIPFGASVIGDLPAHTRWSMYMTTAASSPVPAGGVIIAQHQMPSYRTIWGANAFPISAGSGASFGVETLAANPSLTQIRQLVWTSSTSPAGAAQFTQFNVGGEPEIQNLASSTRVFVGGFHPNMNASIAGQYPMRIVSNAGGFKTVSRISFLAKMGSGNQVAGQLVDFGEINRSILMTPDGQASAIRLGAEAVFDITAASNSIASIHFAVDAMILVPNENIFIVNGAQGNGADVWGVPASYIGPPSPPATYNILIDTKIQRMWRTLTGGSAMGNEITSYVKGAWPMMDNNPASGGIGVAVGVLGTDVANLVSIPYYLASVTTQVSITYQPRWIMFR